MPALPPAAKTLRTVFSGTYGAAKWANVMHMTYTNSAPTNSDCDAIAAVFRDTYHTNLMTHLASTTLMNLVTVTDLSSSTAGNGQATSTFTGGGSAATNMGAGTAIAISWRIHRRYRGGHPRTYLVGMESANLASTIAYSTTFTNNIAADAAAFLTAINGITFSGIGPFVLGSLSYFQDKALRAVPLFDPFTSSSVDSRVDSQRRRLGKDY